MTLAKNFLAIGDYVINISNICCITPSYRSYNYNKYIDGCTICWLNESSSYSQSFSMNEEDYKALQDRLIKVSSLEK